MTDIRIEDLREPERTRRSSRSTTWRTMEVDLAPDALVAVARAAHRPGRLRRPDAARSPGGAGRRGRGRHRPVGHRALPGPPATGRAARGPAALRGLRAPPPRGAGGGAGAAGDRRGAPPLGHDPSGEPARHRHPVPVAAVVGGRRADPGARATGPVATASIPATSDAVASHEATLAVSPLTALMHDRPPSAIEEECELLDLDLCTYVLEWHARVPRLARPRRDARPARPLRVPPHRSSRC